MVKRFSEIKVSAIIPTIGNPDKISNTIQSLLNGTRRPDEILVSDQSDDMKTKEIVDGFNLTSQPSRVKYLKLQRKGLSVNRNNAINATTGEFIVSIDDDATVDKKWLENILDEWVNKWNKGLVVITGPIYPNDTFESGTLVTALRQDKSRRIYDHQPRIMGVLIGAHFAARKDLFEKVGNDKPFDERLGVGTRMFPAAEDDEFGYRVQKANIPIVYEPSIYIYHHTERITGWRKMRYTRAIASGASIAKHLLLGDIRVIKDLVEAILINLVKGIKGMMSFKEPEGSSRVLASFGLILGFFYWILAAATGQLNQRMDVR